MDQVENVCFVCCVALLLFSGFLGASSDIQPCDAVHIQDNYCDWGADAVRVGLDLKPDEISSISFQ